jgi:hypothetical protein
MKQLELDREAERARAMVGLVQVESSWTHSLKAPGFSPTRFQTKARKPGFNPTRFQTLLSQMQLVPLPKP